MKKLIMLSILSFFISGCLSTCYEHAIYENGKLKEKWKLPYEKAMTTSTIIDVNLYLSDGSKLIIGKSAFVYDGNDWIKLGQGISTSGIPSLFIAK
jgi:hypothetical protein